MTLTNTEKEILNLYCELLEAYDEDTAQYGFYYSGARDEYETGKYETKAGFLENDFTFFEELNEIAKKIYREYDLSQYLNEEAKWQEFQVIIIASKKEILVQNVETLMDVDYFNPTIVSYKDMSDKQKEGFQEMNDNCDSNSEIIDFYGGGDDGYVESRTLENNDVDGRIEDLCYEMLNKTQSGWEIDEGSSGNFELNYLKKFIKLNFGLNIERTETQIIDTIPFG